MEEKNLLSIFIGNRYNPKKGVTIIKSADLEVFISYAEIYLNACKYLEMMQQKGLKKGNELLYQVEDLDKFLYIFWACQLGGITAVPVDVGENDENNIKIFRIWNTLNNPYFMSDKENLIKLNKYNDAEVSLTLKNINKNYIDTDIPECSGEKCIFHNYIEDEYIALIIFSSGSTGVPKGIPITYNSLYKHVNALAKREKVSEKDVTINWAPLSHNLGLVSVHLISTSFGISQFMMPKKLFVKNPLLWMDKASEHKATMIYSPNFGYNYILTHNDPALNKKWDLSNIRIAFNGAEPINFELCSTFVKAMKKYGLNQNVMYPAYGCSESTSVISIPNVGEPLKAYKVDRKRINFGDKVILAGADDDKNAVSLVSVGYPVDKCEVRVCDKDNRVLPDFYVGCLQVRGENVIKSYYNNEKATKESFVGDGWFNTGDLCFRDKETIVITGREKEIIFISGQNYYPYDIERIAEKADKYLPGKIAACGVFSEDIQTDEIIIFVEYNGAIDSFLKLSEKIKLHVSLNLGLYIGRVVPVPKLEKTDSGKLQRLKLGKNYSDGLYDAALNELESLVKTAADNKSNKLEISLKEQVQNNLLAIWRETLANENIDINDNFFDLGGSSTMLIVLTSKIEKLYKDCISAIDFFEAPTISKQAELILKDKMSQQMLLENRFPQQFLNLSDTAEKPEYELILQNLAKYPKLTSQSESDTTLLVMAVNIELFSKVLLNNTVNLNIISNDKKFIKLLYMDISALTDFEQLVDELKRMLNDTTNSVEINSIKNSKRAEGLVTVFSMAGEYEPQNGLSYDILIWAEPKEKRVAYKINKNRINPDVFKKFLDKYELVFNIIENQYVIA